MNLGQTVFSQVMQFFPLRRFHTCVERYRGDAYVKQFSCLDQFRVMALAQLTYRRSLRDITACLKSLRPKLYHIGIQHCVARNTLAKANERRDWRIYADIAQVLINRARQLYADEDFGKELQDVTLYALDASMIDLCLSTFPWAPYKRNKGAIKLHTLIDLRGNIPTFMHLSDGKVHDVNALDLLVAEPGAFYIMDRGYFDFRRLYKLHQSQSFFITRDCKDTKLRRRYSRPVDKSTGLLCDQTVMASSENSARHYPEPLRRVKYRDPKTEKQLVFLTNHFGLSALTIAQLYKQRWQVELFFKWIKQHLYIKKFYGTSENAVKTQIWIAFSTYLLVAIVKKELGLDQSLYEILQFMSMAPFEKTLINELFSHSKPTSEITESCKQLTLFNL